MGKISILTEEQKTILAAVSQNENLKSFYFTGGTALSEFYLHHRYSQDLDFFSDQKINNQLIFNLINHWSKEYNFSFTSEFKEVVYSFYLFFKNQKSFKVDFGYYPYPCLKKGLSYQKISIDSFYDIGVNKLIAISQRTDVKDFVDLYFILKTKKFTLWDLIYGVEKKFKHFYFDSLLLAEDFLKVDNFNTLPKMIKPFKIEDLKKFFQEKAEQLGRKVIK